MILRFITATIISVSPSSAGTIEIGNGLTGGVNDWSSINTVLLHAIEIGPLSPIGPTIDFPPSQSQAPHMADLTHLDESNQPHMVDVSAKTPTIRIATASCLVKIGTELISQMDSGELKNKKGPVLHPAILAGISGTKKTSELIPLCHPLPLDSAKIEITPHDKETLLVTAIAKTTSRTGVEMEALTGASTAALTLYDMCKAANPAIIITALKLVTKTGGKSDYQATQ